MKKMKKLLGIILAFAIVMQCGFGYVVSKAATQFSSTSATLNCTDVTVSRVNVWDNFTYKFTMQNTGSDTVSGFSYVLTLASGKVITGSVGGQAIPAGGTADITFEKSPYDTLGEYNYSSINSCDITSCQIVVPEYESNYSWLKPISIDLTNSNGNTYKLSYNLQNNSNKKKVTAFKYEMTIRYTENGASKEKEISGEVTVDIPNNTSKEGSFEFDAGQQLTNPVCTYFYISSATYEKSATATAPQLTQIQNPVISSDKEDGDLPEDITTYVSWACVKFGKYHNKSATDSEPILWRVLSQNADGTLTLMADQAVTAMPYGSSMKNETWESSAVREFLNNDFYNEAFSAAEQQNIVEVALNNSDAGAKSSGGNNTKDKLYLLSKSDLSNLTYGLFAGSGKTVPTRQIGITDYAKSEGGKQLKVSGDGTYASYFLRTPGYYQHDVMGVTYNGNLKENGWKTYSKTAAVVPVMNVNASAVTFDSSVSRSVTGMSTQSLTNAQKSKAKVKSATESSKNVVAVGDKKTVGNVTYKVTASGTKAKKVAVASVKKNVKSVSIPSTVTIKGKKYKVTSIKANAFKNAKKQLKTVTITSKYITLMDKKAFTGLTKKTTVKITKKYYKKYKKMIKNKKVVVKKK